MLSGKDPDLVREKFQHYFGRRKRRRAAAQFYDPSSGRSWSGRGPRPKWLVGKNLDDYRIDRVPQPWWPGEEAA